MTPHYALKAVDAKLRDLTKCQRPFGGKTIVLGGDFQQCLPVVKRGSQVDMVQACVKNGDLWPLFQSLKLQENKRMTDPEFQAWLLKVGNGELLNTDNLPENVVEIRLNLALVTHIYICFAMLHCQKQVFSNIRHSKVGSYNLI